jgi:diacylglycerol kinase family enzyme
MKARKVRQSTLDMISQHVDVDDVYVTRTIEQSDQSLDEIIEKKYPLVLSGGGDGTAMRIIEQMRLKVGRKNAAGGQFAVPRFGLLKLGTGNGWAGLLETPARVAPIWALRQMREHEMKFTPFNMIESENRLCHFGGFGLDALILNNYIDLKNRFKKGFMWKLSNSMIGYLWATFMISAPQVVIRRFAMNVRIVNNSEEPVFLVGPDGAFEQLPLKKGETLYEGRTLIVGVGTTSNYGFKLKIFPWACAKPGYMNLRIGDTNVPQIMANVRPVWAGRPGVPGLKDWLVKDVIVESEKEMPYQLGGDPEGYRTRGQFKVSDFTVDMLDFRRP